MPIRRASDSALPTPATALVGREAELATVRAMLDAGETRLVTLTGPGGIGKTRLALAVAASLETDFAHGALFMPLASVRDPDLIPAAVARALGLQESGDRAAADLVLAALRDRHMLLVLDNLEHVLDQSATLTSELLDGCPRLTVLTTSRIALQVAGEHRYPVPPLAVPGVDAAGDVEQLSHTSALQLFVQRARAVRPDFALTSENAAVVGEICRALEGLPLAIELAAARLRVLSPAALLARLTDRLSILRGNVRDAPARHRTIRDTIAWSHDLLGSEQRRLFRSLSVFLSGFTLEAAEAVGSEAGGAPVLDLLTDLIDHSLVRQIPTETGEDRFGMLEVIREYGLEQLEAAGEVDAARDAHAEWCLKRASAAAGGIEGRDQVRWLRALDAEHDNIRGALTWLIDSQRIDDAQDLAGVIWFYYWFRALYAEGRQLFEQLVTHPGGTAGTVARARVLAGLGTIAAYQGDLARSTEALDEAIEILRRDGTTGALAWAVMCRGNMFLIAGRLDEAEAELGESLEMGRALDDAWVIAADLNLLGICAGNRGHSDRARDYWQELADVTRAAGSRWGLGLAVTNLGFNAMESGDLARAAAYLEESEALSREIGDWQGRPIRLIARSDLAERQGDHAAALSLRQEALAEAQRFGDSYTIGWARLGLARLALASGQVEASARHIREAISAFRRLESPNDLVPCIDMLVDEAISARDMSHAARLTGATDAALEQAGMARGESWQGEHEARVDTLVAALGQDGYRAAWEGGQELSLDEAIAEALAWEPPLDAARRASGTMAEPDPASELTPRERQVLSLMAEGLTNQQIADRLYLSRRTATSHASNILGKLGLETRTAAVAWALRNGIA